MQNSEENGSAEQTPAHPVEQKHDRETDNGQGEAVERDLHDGLGDGAHLDVVRDKVSAVVLQLDQVVKVGREDETGDRQQDRRQHHRRRQQAGLVKKLFN